MRPYRTSASGLLLALLALTIQLAFGAVVPRFEVASALAGATTICHASETSDPAPAAPHHPPDCPICPLCASLSVPAVALSARAALPAPRVVVVATPKGRRALVAAKAKVQELFGELFEDQGGG